MRDADYGSTARLRKWVERGRLHLDRENSGPQWGVDRRLRFPKGGVGRPGGADLRRDSGGSKRFARELNQ
jgi:hypothetical protein